MLILSQHIDLDFVRPLLEEGAEHIGYLLKDRILDISVLVDALHRIDAGDCVIDPSIVQQLLVRRRHSRPIDELTKRERDVLALIAEGLTNHAIGERLFISERTVEVHTKQIFNKLCLIDAATGNRRVLAVLAYLDGRRNLHALPADCGRFPRGLALNHRSQPREIERVPGCARQPRSPWTGRERYGAT